MPPKKGKKGKKGGHDDWTEPSTTSTSKQPISLSEDQDQASSPVPVKKSLFSALEQEGDNPTFNQDEEGEDLGGLMATLGKAKGGKGGKKGKKGKKMVDEDEEDALAILARLDLKEAQERDRLAADDHVESSVDEAPKKTVSAPKGKKGKKKNDFDDEEDAAAILARLDAEEAAAATASSSADTKPAPKQAAEPKKEKEKDDDNDDAAEPGTIHIKSKKEKERERKERAKLAKKKQAPKKGGLDDVASPGATTPPAVEDDEPVATSGKGKKKVKGPSAAILAIREAMAVQKAAEEQAAREAEEEERRLAEIAAREAEEARIKEEARQAKKEKEKLRKEELKKAGLYLTPAQKAAQAAQKAKLEALLASGVVVPALAKEGSEEAGKRKKPVYSNRKKKQPSATPAAAATSAPVKAVSVASVASSSARDEDEVKESWDDEEEKEPVKEKEEKAWDASSSEEDVKDSWDQDSEDEKEKKKTSQPVKPATPSAKPEPKVAVKAESKPAPVKSDANPVSKPAAKPAPAKPVAKKEEEEEEEDDEDDSEEDSDDDDDDEDDSDDDSDDDDEEMTVAEKLEQKRKEEAAVRRQERIAASYAARSKDNLRSPICVILGHVDTGKTKLLDKIRQTNVQEGEAGGITQQIGATYFPLSAIEEKTEMIHKGEPSGYKLPGLLVIDTPGHESFTNLRSRGSSLCNIAVLVVDIVHGLEPQTIESLNLLRQRKTPFIVALNKIDRLFDWETHANYPTRETLALQKKSVISEFNDRVTKTIVAFAEQGLNACLYWDNKNLGRNVSLVPTSAVTGEGVPDLLHLLMDLTQSRMTEKLMYLSELECTVLEVKVIEGLGTTIDVVLSNGVLNEGDRICVCGLNGPIVTNVRALLTPQPMRELRVKSQYQHHKSVKASLGIKISAPDLEKAIAGSRLLLIGPDDDEEEIMEEVMGDLTSLLTSIDKSGKGVCVQASTLGSLEALLSFLKDSKIPVSGINIGPVHKKDIIRASVMLERAKEYAQLLAFDVPIDKDAEQLAADMGVKIFSANIIYHLFDKFTAYMKELEEQKRKDAMPTAVFPCVLKMVPEAIFNKRAPIIIGVDVVEGVLKVGTPLCVVNKESGQTIDLGKVVGIELNHKSRNEVKRGDPAVAIRIECPNYATTATYGRHFTQDDDIYAKISRDSIDVLKTTFRNEMTKDDWALVIKLKKVLSIA